MIICSRGPPGQPDTDAPDYTPYGTFDSAVATVFMRFPNARGRVLQNVIDVAYRDEVALAIKLHSSSFV